METSTQSRHRGSITNQVRVSTGVDCALGEGFVEAGHHDRLSPFPVRTLTSMSAHSTRSVFVGLLVIAPHLATKPAYSLTSKEKIPMELKKEFLTRTLFNANILSPQIYASEEP